MILPGLGQRCGVVILAFAVSLPAMAASQSLSSGEKTTRTSATKAVLPDPLLLDGSNQAVEKKNEIGMIGEFEMPGDENVRSGRVGGPQAQMPAGAGGSKVPSAAMPKAGGGGAQPSTQSAGVALPPALPAGAGEMSATPNANANPGGIGGQAGGPENPNAAGKPVGAAGAAGAQPVGTQVAELGGAGAESNAGAGGEGGGKSPGVMIGDKQMRIDTSAMPPNAVGAPSQAPNVNTQIYEKPTGTGGKGPTGTQGPNRAEKGRVMPAGL